MAEENTTPENQDTSEEKLILGKYKTNEEAQEAMKEMERKVQEQAEELERERRVNSLLTAEQPSYNEPEPQRQSTADYSQYSSQLTNVFDEDQAQVVQSLLEQQRQDLEQRTRSLIDETVRTVESRRSAEEQFFSIYPNLKPFKREVDEQARLLTQELGDRARKIPFETLSKEVAKRVTEHLAEQRKRLTKNPLHLETGVAETPKVKTEEPEKTPASEDERTQKYFEEEVRQMNEKRLKPLRG